MARRRSVLQRYLTHGGRYAPGDPDYRRIVLLNLSLLVTTGVAVVFTGLNLFLLGKPLVALLDVGVALVAFALIFWFRRGAPLVFAAWAALGLIGLFIAGYIGLVGTGHYALIWLGVYPGLAFFLLGRRHGLWASLALVGATLAGLALLGGGPRSDAVELVGAFNVFGALLCLVLFAHYVEASRQQVLRALVESNRQLQQLSTHDRLTGLYNRLKLDQRLAEELARAQRHGSPFSVVLVDIDRFKLINDRCGHAVGDLVLQCLGHVLLRGRRASDMVGRWGGEEFLLICPETPLQGAVLVAERLREATQDAPMPEAGRVTLSAGVAAWRPADTIESLLARADAALYEAKSEGRNRVGIEAPADG